MNRTHIAILTACIGELVSLAALAQSEFMTFPLRNKTPFNAAINSIFDHAMISQYCADQKVVAYTGEEGNAAFGVDPVNQPPARGCDNQQLAGYAQQTQQAFNVNGHYTGGGNTLYLYYEGHPGYDYRTTDQKLDGLLCQASTVNCNDNADDNGKTAVVAAADGTVDCVRYLSEASAECTEGPGEVRVKHGSTGYHTVYLHLSEIRVSKNTPVIGGVTVLGVSGGTGTALDAYPRHLHFEARKQINTTRVPVDAYGWWGGSSDPYKRAVNVPLWLNPCALIVGGNGVPDGYGVPWNVFSPQQELLLQADCGTGKARIRAGLGREGDLVYPVGYQVQGNAWQQITFTGDKLVNGWIQGAAMVDLTRTTDELKQHNYVISYTCSTVDGQWKCGCRDSACATSYWQLQDFQWSPLATLAAARPKADTKQRVLPAVGIPLPSPPAARIGR